MSSDEEDFNDIYGEETNSTPVITASVNGEKDVKTVKEGPEGDQKAGEALEMNKDTNQVGQSNKDQPSHLDALQALSSQMNQVSTTNSNNINNINNNNNSNNNNSNFANNTNLDSTNNVNNNNEVSPVNNVVVSHTNNLDDNNGDANVNGNSNNFPQPGGMPWGQFQQTMPGFPNQQPAMLPPQPQQNVKADISKDSCKMFIGGLNWETTEDGLRNYFNKYGNVIELKIMKDGATGRSRGFGFLTFEHPSSVDEVVKTQHILDGKVIDPKRSIPKEEQDKIGKIFVGGIGTDVRPKEFEEFFAQFGTIIDAQLMLDKDTGRSRGFGFITYDSADAVDKVCQNKYIDFKGKQIEVKRAQQRHSHGKPADASNSQMLTPNPMATPGMVNPMGQMYQNPMMPGFNPMFNPQAMTDYYQRMQDYYKQMQAQTGIDYSQMYQQQMAMMMPGFSIPQGTDGSGSPTSDSVTPSTQPEISEANNEENSSSNVQTIGEESAPAPAPAPAPVTIEPSIPTTDEEKTRAPASPPLLNLPKGPRDPTATATIHHQYQRNNDRGHYYSNGRDRKYGRDEDRDRDRDRGRGGYHGGHRGGYRGNRGRGGGYNKRKNGYRPY
ncbi:Hrp1p NDAI_0G03970 [Naumovozyma dairenensis CBS 421]|uniref:RRM domain-containing protein n=1 Tax=Naumovozyma dairenensis (strain ATCC 10597 / BCRC 20456 / CBS 421 / NBRC 0211 / NRRL Y-12639) TaxID=1071378 RepID=G0WEG3_NAUDC|nr:hypothetical protein NDAI_0G03970 [Naumovozyma dairenensis CBS 421]CCD26174.2 hypothetical protein NDAI_0G03970 [Naumovozyma dairenensis CBS 421]